MTEISAAEHPKSYIDVNGKQMAFVDLGSGDPILFLHGNPTSSYLWRNIMPHVQHLGRCIAPDLIGMGDSEKLEKTGPGSYRFAEHAEYLQGFIDAIAPDQQVTLVIHDWGSALGFDFANRNRDRVRAIAYMEALVRPYSDEEFPAPVRPVFDGLRSEAGDKMVLEQNFFVEKMFPNSVLREMTDAEMDVYRRPFANPGEDRRPTLTWPREIPIAGTPADTAERMQASADWMAENEMPKLFVNAKPGAMLSGAAREFCRTWKNQTEVTVKGLHFIQEDSPHEIGAAIADWYSGL